MSASYLSVVNGTFGVARSGAATIPIGAATVQVNDPNITANSVVLAQIMGAAADATLTSIARVTLTAGTRFTIVGNAAATAAVQVSWVVVQY
jgi:hypothetical protein